MASFSIHPIVLMIYFFSIIGITMFIMHPVYIFISVVASLLLAIKFTPFSWKQFLLYVLLFGTMLLVNPFISQQGQQILFELGQRMITVEAVIYGGAIASLLIAILLWFQLYNLLIPAEKFLYVAQKITPQFALLVVISMRLVTTFTKQITCIITAQKAIGNRMDGTLRERLQMIQRVLSILTVWALENAIETADSMKARGYGKVKRTAFSLYTWDTRDTVLITIIALLNLGIIISIIHDQHVYTYYPLQPLFEKGVSGFISFLILSSLLAIVELWEWYKWRK